MAECSDQAACRSPSADEAAFRAARLSLPGLLETNDALRWLDDDGQPPPPRSPTSGHAAQALAQAEAQAEARALLLDSPASPLPAAFAACAVSSAEAPAADKPLRRRRRIPRAWSAAREGRADDLRAALQQRTASVASAGPTARLGSRHESQGPTRSLNWGNEDGTTALHAASTHGHELCVQLLLDAHAELDPRQKGGATPLILAARHGHSACVARLLGAGADIARRDATGTALDNARAASCWGGEADDDEPPLEGSNAACISVLEAAEEHQSQEEAALLRLRQREAAELARAAAARQAGPHLARLALDRPRAASASAPAEAKPRLGKFTCRRLGGAGGGGGAEPAAPSALQLRDEMFAAACEAMAARRVAHAWAARAAARPPAAPPGPYANNLRPGPPPPPSCCAATHGFEPGHVTPPELEAWLAAPPGRARIEQLAEQLPALRDEDGRETTGRELALAIRVLQMHLRESAQPAAGGMLGQDQLVPLLVPLLVETAASVEPLLVAARPRDAWSLHARMQGISEQELFDKPDLASAVDGWDAACCGVEAQALARWRAGAREAVFWRALCRQPPPDVLRSSVCLENRAEPLPRVFASFLSHLAAAEEEAWSHAQSAAAHAMQIEQIVAELCPGGGQGILLEDELPDEHDVFGPYGRRDITQAV